MRRLITLFVVAVLLAAASPTLAKKNYKVVKAHVEEDVITVPTGQETVSVQDVPAVMEQDAPPPCPEGAECGDDKEVVATQDVKTETVSADAPPPCPEGAECGDGKEEDEVQAPCPGEEKDCVEMVTAKIKEPAPCPNDDCHKEMITVASSCSPDLCAGDDWILTEGASCDSNCGQKECCTAVPKSDDGCSWDYTHFSCSTPKYCSYQYHFGDFFLGTACRLVVSTPADGFTKVVSTNYGGPVGQKQHLRHGALVSSADSSSSSSSSSGEDDKEPITTANGNVVAEKNGHLHLIQDGGKFAVVSSAQATVTVGKSKTSAPSAKAKTDAPKGEAAQKDDNSWTWGK